MKLMTTLEIKRCSYFDLYIEEASWDFSCEWHVLECSSQYVRQVSKIARKKGSQNFPIYYDLKMDCQI